MNGHRHLLLEYYSDERSESGVPLILVSFDPGISEPPYLRCFTLSGAGESLGVDTSLKIKHVLQELFSNLATQEGQSDYKYMEAVVDDIFEASHQSREAALLLFKRLEMNAFGPIRSLTLDNVRSDGPSSSDAE